MPRNTSAGAIIPAPWLTNSVADRSKTFTWSPALDSSTAAAQPAIEPPTTAIRYVSDTPIPLIFPLILSSDKLLSCARAPALWSALGIPGGILAANAGGQTRRSPVGVLEISHEEWWPTSSARVRYPSPEKCLRIGTNRTCEKPHCSSPKAIVSFEQPVLANLTRKPEASPWS